MESLGYGFGLSSGAPLGWGTGGTVAQGLFFEVRAQKGRGESGFSG